MAPSSRWKKTFICACLCLSAAVQGTFLEPYQAQLTELHTGMKAAIGARFRQNSELNAQLIEQDLLPLVAEGTVAIRNANADLLQQIENIRPDGASSECWESVDLLIYLYTLFPQWDLQDCAYGGYSQWIRDDARERFYPVAHEFHRTSSEVINTIIGVLSEDDAVANADEVESRLDANLNHFNELTIEGVQDLDEEIERHDVRREQIERYMRECIDRTIAVSRDDVEYTIRYAEFHCL